MRIAEFSPLKCKHRSTRACVWVVSISLYLAVLAVPHAEDHVTVFACRVMVEPEAGVGSQRDIKLRPACHMFVLAPD